MNNKLFIKRGTRTVGVCAYQDRTDITTVRIPEGVKCINNGAFCRCIEVRDISFPESLKIIGEMSFACTGIKDIVIPDGVEFINERAFAFNHKLRSVHIGKGVKRILSGAFSGCPNLEKITIDPHNDCYYVQNGCLIAKDEKKLIVACSPYVISEGVKTIENQAFMFLTSCDSITLPASVEYINMNSWRIKNFDMCRRLEYGKDHEMTVNKPVVIKAPRGSYAEAFAKEQNIKFEEI